MKHKEDGEWSGDNSSKSVSPLPTERSIISNKLLSIIIVSLCSFVYIYLTLLSRVDVNFGPSKKLWILPTYQPNYEWKMSFIQFKFCL